MEGSPHVDDLSDDSARRVLADHGQGGFDAARGELVNRQCDGTVGGALLEAHRQRWRRKRRPVQVPIIPRRSQVRGVGISSRASARFIGGGQLQSHLAAVSGSGEPM